MQVGRVVPTFVVGSALMPDLHISGMGLVAEDFLLQELASWNIDRSSVSQTTVPRIVRIATPQGQTRWGQDVSLAKAKQYAFYGKIRPEGIKTSNSSLFPRALLPYSCIRADFTNEAFPQLVGLAVGSYTLDG